MLDIYADKAQVLVVKKGAQAGLSTEEILKMLHDAKELGLNQIYTLPTVDDVGEFVKSKVNRIMKVNPCIKKDVSRKDIDSIEQKQIGKAFIFFKGTHTEKEAIMLSSDRNIHDELDKSKPKVIQDYTSRMAYSKIRSQHFFSTPTIPDTGIDKLYQKSDQKHWRFNCPHCDFRQHMEWEENVDFKRKIYVCKNCRKELTPKQISELGSWEAKYPGRRMSGYWISQMICPWRTAADLIKEREDAEDEQYFYNFVLGLAFISADQKIEASLFLRNIIEKGSRGEELNVAGIDVGKSSGKGLHVIIGNKEVIFWIGILKDKILTDGKTHTAWKQLAELIQFYDVRVGVIDGMYETEKCLKLANKFPYRIYLNFYKEDPKMLEVSRFGDEKKKRPEEFEEEIKVLTSRNRVMDDSISALRKGEARFAMSKDSSTFKLLIRHAQNMYARKVEDRFGQMKREWESIGEDDFWHAFIYWRIALNKKLKSEPNV